MHATWMWCIASTMPLEPQPWASAVHIAASSCMLAPRAAELLGHGRGQQLRLAERLDRLVGKSRLGVDVGGVRAATSWAMDRVRVEMSLVECVLTAASL